MKIFIVYSIIFITSISATYSQQSDSAKIVQFNPPIGSLQRGDTVEVKVRVENTGTTTRKFWVGLSFAPQNVLLNDWPVGWYDVYPNWSCNSLIRTIYS